MPDTSTCHACGKTFAARIPDPNHPGKTLPYGWINAATGAVNCSIRCARALHGNDAAMTEVNVAHDQMMEGLTHG